jgi:hypothetical protein
MLVAPERSMSSAAMTKTSAAALERDDLHELLGIHFGEATGTGQADEGDDPKASTCLDSGQDLGQTAFRRQAGPAEW